MWVVLEIGDPKYGFRGRHVATFDSALVDESHVTNYVRVLSEGAEEGRVFAYIAREE